MVTPRGIEIIHAVTVGIIDHLERGRLVDLAVVPVKHGKAHQAKPEVGKFLILEIAVNHVVPHPLRFRVHFNSKRK